LIVWDKFAQLLNIDI